MCNSINYTTWAAAICCALQQEDITCVEIGTVEAGFSQVQQSILQGRMPLPCPERDEIARIFEG
jgi:hypothetical protein